MTFPPYEPKPEQNLAGDLMKMQQGWKDLGIDADDFLRCGACGKFIYDLVKGTEPEVMVSELCTCD